MNTTGLKPGDKVGIFFYDDRRGSKAIIEEIVTVSPTGIVTVKSGTRYTSKGKEIGALADPTYLCTLEKAQAIIKKAAERKQQKEEYTVYVNSIQGKRDRATNAAVKALTQVLNQYGWYGGVDGDMDVMESEIKQIILNYLEKHDPIS